MKKLIYLVIFTISLSLYPSYSSKPIDWGGIGYTLIDKIAEIIKREKTITTNFDGKECYKLFKTSLVDTSKEGGKFDDIIDKVLLLTSKRTIPSYANAYDPEELLNISKFIKNLNNEMYRMSQVRFITNEYFDEIRKMPSHEKMSLKLAKNKGIDDCEHLAYKIITENPNIKEGAVRIDESEFRIFNDNFAHLAKKSGNFNEDLHLLIFKNNGAKYLWKDIPPKRLEVLREFFITNPNFAEKFKLNKNKKFADALYQVSEKLNPSDVKKFISTTLKDVDDEKTILKFFTFAGEIDHKFLMQNPGDVLTIASHEDKIDKVFLLGLQNIDYQTLMQKKAANAFADPSECYAIFFTIGSHNLNKL